MCSFITQTFAENDIRELSIVGRARKHLKVILASANMKSSILQCALLNHPTNVYINEYLTQKRSTLLYKLRVIKKDNPAIGSVYTRNGSIYKLHSDRNKQYVVNEESDLPLIIIIYHDFLPTPRRGSHVKSGKTHTQSSRYTP